jgi:hypothetical protein
VVLPSCYAVTFLLRIVTDAKIAKSSINIGIVALVTDRKGQSGREFSGVICGVS